MKLILIPSLYCLACLSASAQPVPVTIRVSSETVPPGGLAQMKVLMTSPKPITGGNMLLDMTAVPLDSIDGIALFSDTGDVGGTAVVNGGAVNVQFTSPNGTFGTNADYPLLTVALTVSQNTVPGQTFPVSLDPLASIWRDLLGVPIVVEHKPATITVGGNLAITNVVPGGGALPAGATFSILGMGFTPRTKVNIPSLLAYSTQYVSPTEIQVTPGVDTILDGTRVTVREGNDSDIYYSYMRGIPADPSARPLLARTVPVFSIMTATEAILPPTISPQVNPDYFTAIALQNPTAAPVEITVESYSGAGDLTGSTLLTLAPRYRISREVSELFGATLPTGSYLRIVATQPVQMLGLLGNDQTGVVLPVAVSVLKAPVRSLAPAPIPADDGGGKRK